MKVSVALIAAVPAVASAGKLRSFDAELPSVDISSTSVMGSRILSKARRLEGENNNNNNNYDTTWVSGYSLKFHSCVTSQDYYGGYFADNQDNAAANYEYNGDNNEEAEEQEAQAYGNSYYNNEQRNNYEGMYYQKLVHFKLCPSNSCWQCKNGADYVVELNDYVDAVLEAQMTAKEYNCEHVRENCYCGSANSEEECLSGCYSNAGLTDCAEAEDGAFDLQKAVECMNLDVDKDKLAEFYNTQAGNNYAAEGQENKNQVEKLYAGPYCSADGKKILLGVFVEETCSYSAPTGIYEALHYGESLPYAKKSLIGSGCTSCKEPSNVEDQNNWDQQDADSVLEVCSNLYSTAGKCEEGLSGYSAYRDNSGCEYIKSLKNPAIISMGSTNIPAKVFAGIFGVTTIALAALTVSLCRQKHRQNVSLTDDHPLA